MVKTLISIVASLALLTSAAAQTTSDEPTRTRLGEQIRDLQEGARESIQAQREEFTGRMREQRDAFKTRIETIREELKVKIDAQRDALKSKLANIRDERKKEVVNRVAEQFVRINENRVEHYTNVLDQLSKVLERIVTRTDKAEGRGLAVSAVRTEISNAEAAIARARTAVQAQAGKTYPVTVTTEANLKTSAGAARDALRNDLRAAQALVKAAREAVHKAATTLAQIPRVDDDTAATSTGGTAQ